MGVPTWRRLGRGWVSMFTRRRSSRRSPTRSRASWRCSGWVGRPSRWRSSAPVCRRRCGSPMRRARPASGWRERWPSEGYRLHGRRPGQDRAPGAGPGQDRPPRRRAAGAAADDRRPAPGAGSDARPRRRCATWSGPRGRPRRPDAGPPPRRQALAAPRPALRWQQLDPAPPRLAGAGRARRARGPVGPARRDRVDRRPAGAPREPRGPDGIAGRGLPLGAAGRPPALPARHRHPLGPRALRGGRRLRALRPPRAADELPRPGALRELAAARRRRQGAITKSGSRHARRLLVEAAWHYRRAPRKGRELRRRQEGQPQAVCAISWKAQQRLHRSWSASTQSAASAAPSARSPSPVS